MKKVKLLFLAVVLMVSAQVNAADNPVNRELNLINPDVRKCLIEASQAEGWKLEAYYFDKKDNLVMVFGKEGELKTYISK